MNTKHTPGPWHTGKPELSNGYVWINPPDGCCGEIATAWHIDQGSAEANARLIAAAPDLLETLIGLLDAVQSSVCKNSGPAQDAARVAIAKATGA